MFKSPVIHRTPRYRARAAYNGMKKRCLNANGKNPTYKNVELRMSLESWLLWAIPRYARFIGRYRHLSPCAARIGDKGHYEIGNIQIISTRRNSRETNSCRYDLSKGERPCTFCKEVKPLPQFYKRGARVTSRCRKCLYRTATAQVKSP